MDYLPKVYRVFLIGPWLLTAALSGCGGDDSDSGSAPPAAEFRTPSGAHNNPDDPDMGRAETTMSRMAQAEYADGLSAPSGQALPNPRAVSNLVASQNESRLNARGASDYLWQWGQFVDHDLTLAREHMPHEPMPIPVPPGDEHFDPSGTGAAEIPFDRSEYDPQTGQSGPREQINSLSAYVDASQVYGSSETRALALRRMDGSGKLRTSGDDLLPLNTTGLPNNPSDDPSLFVAGDVRANEQVALTAMHTLFVREHNRLVDLIAAAEPGLSGEMLYQRARTILIAKVQRITYEEFIPLLLGEDALAPYTGYDPQVDASLDNEFATVAFRLGHSLLSPTLLRLDAEGQTIPEGDLPLRSAFFFTPDQLVEAGGIEPLLRGLAAQQAQELDTLVVDDVRNFLFGPPGDGGRDLIALNLQRARDHGLPAYNELRRSLGLTAKATFADVSSDPETQSRLAAAYYSVELIDPWIGCMAEDHLPGAMVGELAFTILKQQFEALRDGDRFWYENEDAVSFSALGRAEVEQASLSRIIRNNTDISDEIPDDVFRVSP